MGEDSVRYDFFQALQEVKKLNPWDIQVEVPLGSNAFNPNQERSPRTTRGEKPVMDLVVNLPHLKICGEFGLFRKNRNDEGSINTTSRTFKMLNDFIRLGIYSHLNSSQGYFVCVADKFMLDHQVRDKRLPKFPGNGYEFHYHKIEQLIGTSNTARKAVHDRFLHRFRDLDLHMQAELVYDPSIRTSLNDVETKLLIWKITVSKFKSRIVS